MLKVERPTIGEIGAEIEALLRKYDLGGFIRIFSKEYAATRTVIPHNWESVELAHALERSINQAKRAQN